MGFNVNESTRYANEVLKLSQRWPRFQVVDKRDSRLMRVIGWLLTPVNPTFLDGYITTIGFTVYMGVELIGTDTGYRALRHEAVHVAQYARWRWLFLLSYLFAFPTVLTMRAYWELQAHAEDIRVRAKERGYASDGFLEQIARQFTGSSYLWMLPFPKLVMWLLKRARARIER